MDLYRLIVRLILLIINLKLIKTDTTGPNNDVNRFDDIFRSVYSECFLVLSFPCVQRKTLECLKQLDNMNEITIIGDYVKFVRVNTTKADDQDDKLISEKDSEELTHLIDQEIDRFFDNHVIKFNALGSNITIPNNIEEFEGRKKRKGGGGGGMMEDHGHFGHKKMMMMAMMCMKMKMFMMLPAMMGMMGIMNFKGMMFSMMSFMVSKMLLLMKILEKKGGLGAASGGGGGSDGGWAVGGGSGGAWMPAGGQDFGGGGGYDANGQWQSRSIYESKDISDQPISYISPVITYINPIKLRKKFNKNNDVIDINKIPKTKSRRKRSIMDVLQNSYAYWMKILGVNNTNRRTSYFPKYKMVNGVKYVYYPYPYRQQKFKAPKEIWMNKIKNTKEESPLITAADFNKGEIIEGAVESRMIKRKFQKMKDTVNETLDDNPWK